jgi:hypothetical protein
MLGKHQPKEAEATAGEGQATEAILERVPAIENGY